MINFLCWNLLKHLFQVENFHLVTLLLLRHLKGLEDGAHTRRQQRSEEERGNTSWMHYDKKDIHREDGLEVTQSHGGRRVLKCQLEKDKFLKLKMVLCWRDESLLDGWKGIQSVLATRHEVTPLWKTAFNHFTLTTFYSFLDQKLWLHLITLHFSVEKLLKFWFQNHNVQCILYEIAIQQRRHLRQAKPTFLRIWTCFGLLFVTHIRCFEQNAK